MKLSFHVMEGDQVEIISGNHKGMIGKVLQLLPKKQQALVEGVRLIKKHIKKNQEHQNGAIIEKEGPIHISNLKVVEKAEATQAA